MSTVKKSYLRMLAGLALALLLSACASTQQHADRNPDDPLEPFNRRMYAFNEGLDRMVAKPVAQAYDTVTPAPVRTGVGNFFNNLQDGWSTVNHGLQLRPRKFIESLFRFSFNTIWGFGGIVNLADDMGFERDKQDLGKTLGRWGVPSGPYLVLPVLGPSTLRDSAIAPIEGAYDLVNTTEHVPSRNVLNALRLVDKRANLLYAGNLLEEAALDKYTFTRNAFMQKRQSEIDALRGKQEAYQDYQDSLEPTPSAEGTATTPAASPSAPLAPSEAP